MKNIIDDLDKRLIELVGENAQHSYTVIAKQLGISQATVSRRLNHLIKNGLLHIVGVVDPSDIGFPLAVIIVFSVNPDKVDEITQMLANRPEIRWVSSTTGRFDIVSMARFRSTDELSDFIRGEISRVNGMRNIETFICLDVRKGRMLPLYLP